MARPVYCSFCGRSQDEVICMIAGPVLVFICDLCVEDCLPIIAAKRAEATTSAAAQERGIDG
ncbi:MAG: hypothetical protein EOS63_17450 [Mesorhizobium sp.]|uniref:ClpX C4-type zinc finger protein n=1 Tax=Mesorhizobium sp. TaxID=1871066 RepID=UPI000FE4FCDF|nr:MAG: hypothetical protein EOS63_17450 [Mesorhizobium sp.]TJW61010.1 MAG: hypothetical protein E5V97_22095 [Mesorhizobium sp.]